MSLEYYRMIDSDGSESVLGFEADQHTAQLFFDLMDAEGYTLEKVNLNRAEDLLTQQFIDDGYSEKEARELARYEIAIDQIPDEET